MPILTPTKSLTSIILREFFPAAAAASTSPILAATYLGPIRTVVPAKTGILGGFDPGTLPPVFSNIPGRVGFQLTWSGAGGTATVELKFGRVTHFAAFVSGTFPETALEVVTGFINAIKADVQTAELIESYIIDSITTSGEATVIQVSFVFSRVAYSLGIFPPIETPSAPVAPAVVKKFDGTGAALGAGDKIDPVRQPKMNFAFPTLKTTWSKIHVKELKHQVLFGLDTEEERYYFDSPQDSQVALANEIAVATQPSQLSYLGDAYHAGILTDLTTITITEDPIPGTQRVTALDVSTGIEYELRHFSDKEATVGTVAASSEFEYTVVGAGSVDGAYEKGDVISFNASSVFLSTVLAVPGASFMIRATYAPRRFVTPQPAFNYKAILPGEIQEIVSATLDQFSVNESASTFILAEKLSPGDVTDISYSKSVQFDSAPFAPIYEVKRKLKVFNAAAATQFAVGPSMAVAFNVSDFGFPSIDLAGTMADAGTILKNQSGFAGLTLVSGGAGPHVPAVDDYTYDSATGRIIFYNDGPTEGATLLTRTTIQILLNGHLPFREINLAPNFNKALTIDASTSSIGTTFHLNAPGGVQAPNLLPLVSVVVTASDSSILLDPADYTVDAEDGSITAASATFISAVKNPLSVSVQYSPNVIFRAPPTLTFKGVSTAPAYWAAIFPPSIADIGGGRFRVYVSKHPTDILPVGEYLINATVAYPVSPEIQLEFMAERNDLDGKLYVFNSPEQITENSDLTDTYAGATITPDLTPANPTLHATVIGISVGAGEVVFMGVGDMTPTRSQKILQRLEREFNPYHIVAISQDEDSILALVGAHINKVVETFAGTQVHLNAGKLRVMYVTFDQRNDLQILPELTKDVASGKARIIKGLSGGIQILTDLATAAGINPGDYIEVYESDVSTPNSLTVSGGIVPNRIKPKAIKIDGIDITSGIRFNVSDVSLPSFLTFAANYPLVRPFPYRIIRRQDDFTLATNLHDKAEAIGLANGGRRRWIRQPDLVVLDDGGTDRILPGYYRSVVEAAMRAANLPHQGFSRFPLSLLVGVERNLGFYSNDDVINVMTDGGIDYAVQEVPNGPVFSLQQLTADRTNQFTQAPTVTQIMDFTAYALYFAMKVYLGVTNISDETLDMMAVTGQATINRMRLIRESKLGPMVLRGTLTKIEPLPETAQNSGVIIKFSILPARATETIEMDLFIDTESTPI